MTRRCDPYDPAALAAVLADQPAYRTRQVRAWLARGVDDPAEMTDLPVGLRARLAGQLPRPPRVLRTSEADGGLTRKVLLGLQPDGEAVESVLMLYPRAGGRAARATVCVSTQAGCAMGCPFCATGQVGFRRQLTMGEIVRQVTVMQRLLTGGGIAVEGAPDHVTNVVFMGMGEPLANLEPTVASVRWLHEEFGLSARAITVSTVGLVPGIRRLAQLDLPITLAVSLHAPDDALRDDLVPPNRQHPLQEVIAACREWLAATGRRLTFEYVLIDGVNAAPEQAAALARLVAPLGAHVNLIPMNPTPAVGWRAPPVAAQRAFAAVLADGGIAATIRYNRGTEIDAACGQLYANHAVASGRILPAARGAAERVGRGRISVVDSGNTTMCLGWLAMRAAELGQAGAQPDAIVAELEAMKPRLRLYAVLDTLEYVQKGGRIGRAQALLGSLLNFKPLITVRDGEVHPVERPRSRQAAMRRVADVVAGQGRVERVAVLQGGMPEVLGELERVVRERLPEAAVDRGEIGIVLGTHAGPVFGVTALLAE